MKIKLCCFQEQQEAAKKSADAKREAEKKRKKAELELVKQGKRPFYLKKCELFVVCKVSIDVLNSLHISLNFHDRRAH